MSEPLLMIGGVQPNPLRASVGSTEATSDQLSSVCRTDAREPNAANSRRGASPTQVGAAGQTPAACRTGARQERSGNRSSGRRCHTFANPRALIARHPLG